MSTRTPRIPRAMKRTRCRRHIIDSRGYCMGCNSRFKLAKKRLVKDHSTV